jgi:hypothetical protein
VAQSHLAIRLEALRRAQNPDGGWGYFSRKGSWLEPTAYAMLALHGDPAADRAWKLLGSWQSKDGGLRPSAEVELEGWGTALWLTLASVRGESGENVQRAITWLVGVEGAESGWFRRLGASLGLFEPGRDLSLTGWPWKLDNSSWVEPTAHSLVALKKHTKFSSDRMRQRMRMGEAQLLDVRCSDGGWNYGSREVLKGDLPSYPETTGLALLGLQGRENLGPSLDLAAKLVEARTSPLARAWLTIALRLHGSKAAPDNPAGTLPADLHEVALEALALPDGNHQFFSTEVRA